MPRGRKKAFKIRIKKETARSVGSIGLVLFSLLSFLSFLFPNYSLNSIINETYFKLFGYTALLVPFLIIFIALYSLHLKWKYLEPRFLLGGILLTVSLGVFFHVFLLGDGAYEAAQDGRGGGILGYHLATVISNAISKAGAFFSSLLSVLIALLIMFDIPLQKITDVLEAYLKKLKVPFFLGWFSGLFRKTSEGKPEVSLTSGVNNSLSSVGTNPLFSAAMTSSQTEEPQEEFVIVSTYSEPQNRSNVNELASVGDSSESITGLVHKREPKLPYANKIWDYPPKELLQEPPAMQVDEAMNEQRKKIIVEKLKSFGLNVRVSDINPGPTVTRFAIEAPPGAKIAKIAALQSDLAMALASPTGNVRIEAPIPGKNLVGIEVPNTIRSPVLFKELLMSDSMRGMKSKIGVAMGKDVGGYTVVYDLAKMPHLLVAGATGSGKSVFLHSLMFSLLFRASPQEVKFILIDPKRVELMHYIDMPHLMTPVITETEKAPSVFRWAVTEMERRYKLFESARSRNIEAYNEKSGFQAIPYVVIVVDELAEIMVRDPAAVEKSIIRLGQLSRATGIHLVLTVQRPSTDIITGLIKANIPSRVAFNVTSQVDSRVIIDQPGAEKLLGRGDMLFVPPDASKPVRLQGAFVSDAEITNTVNWLKNTGFEPEYREEIFNVPQDDHKNSSGFGNDELDNKYDEAVEVVRTSGKASISYLQRRLSIGYSRAARIMDQMEEHGIVSSQSGSKGREISLGGSHHSLPEDDSLDS